MNWSQVHNFVPQDHPTSLLKVILMSRDVYVSFKS